MFTVRWRALASTLKEAWPAWLFVGGVALSVAVGCVLAAALSDAIRYAGMLLQLFGLLTVAVGLSKMRRLFGRPSSLHRVFQWLERLLSAFGRPKSTTIEAMPATARAEVSGELRVTRSVRPGASLEERVSALEQNARQHQEELDTKAQQLRHELAVAKNGIQSEASERLAADQRAIDRIEEVAIGGLHLESVGLMWLILGVVGTSVPAEITALIPHACRSGG